MNASCSLRLLVLCAGLASPVQAELHFLRAQMDGAQANMGNGTGSPGIGTAYVTYDDDTNELTWEVSWQDLQGSPTDMHFHGPAPAGQNAGIVQGIGVASNPAVGSATITPAQGADLLNGLWYVNIHTSTVGGGEIRGQVYPAVLSDDFSSDFSNWTLSTRGLENNAAAGYNLPSLAGGMLTLGGTTTGQYWFGNSLESVETFDSRLDTEVRVTRVSLAGVGTAWRSTIWIFGDDGHYLHYSQNVGETGWQWNARDDGGTGTSLPTGSGNSIAALDPLDTNGGTFEMGIRLEPLGPGQVTMHMLHDGLEVAMHTFTNFPTFFRVILTGQARAIGDSVTAVFDDLVVYQEFVENQGPAFLGTQILLPGGTVGTGYSGTVAGSAADPEDDPITYSKASGPDWLQVAADGTLSGSPGPADAGLNEFMIEASDGLQAAQTTLRIRIADPSRNVTENLFGWWPLNEGSGDVAADLSGNGRDATIVRAASGGLGTGGAGWIEDPECGNVLSFNGADATGTYAIMTDGNPGVYGTLPLFTTAADNDFTWSLWVRAEDNAANNDIILGNRYQTNLTEFAPRQFIKFDSNNFEYDTNNVTGVDYADIVGDQLGKWVHHVIVKDGASFTYYRDGAQAGAGSAGGSQSEQMPLFFGGQGNFDGTATAELWRGALFDVRLYTAALSADEVMGVYINKGVFTTPAGPTVNLDVETSGDDLVFTWDSQGGKLYTLRSETDPSAAEPASWPVFGGNMDIAATPPQNTLTIPRPADPLRLFVIEEFNAPPVSVFSDDFENGQGQWTTGSDGAAGTAWELGTPTVGPLAANSPANCFGTNLDDLYDLNANVWLRSPAIDLTTAGGATLNFAQFRDIEPGFDFGTVSVLDAADDSLLVTVRGGIDDLTLDWESVSFSLPSAALGKMIKIEFRFESDAIQNYPGWYIDDVEVTVP